MKKILMLLQKDFPPDIRLEKEIRTLETNGFEVVLFCPQFSKKSKEDFEYGKTIRIPVIFNSSIRNKALNYPVLFNPRFVYYLIKVGKKFKPDFIHVHDLPMVPFGVILKKILGKKLIFDMHENYPAALIAYDKKGLFNKLFKNYKLAELLENYALKISDKVIAVIEENKERLLSKGMKDEDVVIISNTVDFETFPLEPPNKSNTEIYKDKFIILYTGGVSHNRGLDTPIKAMDKITKEIPNALMLIVGEGDGRVYLQKLVRRLQLEKVVKFFDWPGHYGLSSYFNVADVCMIPQPNIESNNTTIPHKLFEYMSQSKAVIVSDALPLKRIVEDNNCGISFESFNPDAFADAVVNISTSEIDYGKNGREAVLKKYNWNEHDGKKLVELYRSLSINSE